ncbi:hypothetical protein BRADI_4g35221v3 [Brachypodium distachyon]|uniref:Uncharacterized protein n=1 Tax=Brachypodium distachyon TaxID=15368 RepID=A0A2K2CSD0_BRADI|nr:hypothetical protein BRADI_4g35221v3 [Brachypodium distachyon]
MASALFRSSSLSPADEFDGQSHLLQPAPLIPPSLSNKSSASAPCRSIPLFSSLPCHRSMSIYCRSGCLAFGSWLDLAAFLLAWETKACSSAPPSLVTISRPSCGFVVSRNLEQLECGCSASDLQRLTGSSKFGDFYSVGERASVV